jgi:transcriptional regulator with XRE-family HTH domain
LERKLSQERFAEFVGISVDFQSLIERGRNAPSFETIEKMARKLRVLLMGLFDFRGEDRASCRG